MNPFQGILNPNIANLQGSQQAWIDLAPNSLLSPRCFPPSTALQPHQTLEQFSECSVVFRALRLSLRTLLSFYLLREFS